MKQIIRAEDLGITNDRLFLGGRVLDGGSILFYRIEKRVSLELLGYAVVIGACMLALVVQLFSTGSIGILLLVCLLGFGAYREIVRPYVLVVEIYQLGIFEVRGFTYDEAVDVEQTIDELRHGADGKNGRMSDSSSGSY